MTTRCVGGRKHDWRKIGTVYDKQHGLRPTKRQCRVCGEVQDLEAGRSTQESSRSTNRFRGRDAMGEVRVDTIERKQYRNEIVKDTTIEIKASQVSYCWGYYTNVTFIAKEICLIDCIVTDIKLTAPIFEIEPDR